MTLPSGFPDYVAKSSGPVDYLASIAVNTAAHQTEDITDLIAPSHNGLLFVWIASFAYAGGGVLIGVDASLNSLLMVQDTDIGDGEQALVPFAGVYITENAGNTCTIDITRSTGGANPITGTLLVFGISNTPQVLPVQRRHLIGRGEGSGLVAVAGGGTTTIVPQPGVGKYYRYKTIGWAGFIAPAAVAGIQFEQLDTLNVFHEGARAVVAVQNETITFDLQADWGFRVHNFSNQQIFAWASYEVWKV